MDPHLLKEIGPYLAPLLVVAIFARRLIKNPPRKIRVGSLWVMPAIILAGVIAMLASTPAPALWVIAIFVAVAGLGAVVGYLRARHMELYVDSATDSVMSKATPMGLIVVAALFAGRYALKLFFPEMQGGAGYGHNAHLSAAALAFADGGLIFSASMLTAQAVETYLRVRPVLAAHHANKSAAAEPDEVTVLPPE